MACSFLNLRSSDPPCPEWQIPFLQSSGFKFPITQILGNFLICQFPNFPISWFSNFLICIAVSWTSDPHCPKWQIPLSQSSGFKFPRTQILSNFLICHFPDLSISWFSNFLICPAVSWTSDPQRHRRLEDYTIGAGSIWAHSCGTSSRESACLWAHCNHALQNSTDKCKQQRSRCQRGLSSNKSGASQINHLPPEVQPWTAWPLKLTTN